MFSGCVTVTPPEVLSLIEKDFDGAPNCVAMFKALPKDCRDNPSYCLDFNYNKNIQSYQDAAQTTNASFVISRYEENNKVALCNWNRAGTLRGWTYLDNITLSSCEKSRLTFMSKTNTPLKQCEVYAHGNKVLK